MMLTSIATSSTDHISRSCSRRASSKSSLLPSNAQTWVNLRVLFTHGNGVVMSPVTRRSAEGLPILYVQDIPPVAYGGPAVREPRIYFGQGVDTFVIVNGSTAEFDYPKGTDNVYASYDGADGVAVGSMVRRTLFAWYFEDPNILLSQYIAGIKPHPVSSQHSKQGARDRARFCVSTMIPTWLSAKGGSFGFRMPIRPAAGFPMRTAPSERHDQLHPQFRQSRH